MSYEQDHHGKSPSEVRESLLELAVNRFAEHANFDYRDYLTDDEIREYEEATRLDRGEPYMDERSIGKVVIEVYGGVAGVTSKPDDIEVEIIDHDNEEAAGFTYSTQSALDSLLEKSDMPQDEGDWDI